MGSILLSLLMALSIASGNYDDVIKAREAKDTTIRQDLKVTKLDKPKNEKVEATPVAKHDEEWMYFTLTAFTNGPESTGKRPGDKGYGVTASGKRTREGRTIAADPRVLPLGTKVYIEGVGTRIVEDTGGAIKGQKIDVFIEDLGEALEFGKKRGVKVKIIEMGDR